MGRNLLACAVVSACCLLLPGMAVAEQAPLAVYAALAQAEDPRLSPDGKAVALIASRDGRKVVRVWRQDGPEQWYFPGGNDQLNWIAWKGNDRLLLSLRFTRRESGHSVGATRLMFTELANNQSVPVTFREPIPPPNSWVIGRQAFQPPNLQDRVISLLPGDPQSILLSAALNENASHPEVMLVDVQSGRPRPLLKPSGNVVKWLADPDGMVRLKLSFDGGLKGLTIRVRDDESSDWRMIHRYIADRDPRFIPLAFSRTSPATLFVLADRDDGRLALMSFDSRTLSFGPVLAADAQCDIEPLLRDNQLIGYLNPCRGPAETYLDAGWQQDQARVQRALKTELVSIIDRSADGGATLLRSNAHASAPPVYWYLDQSGEKKTLTKIAESYAPLAGDRVARARWVSLKARDGLAIPALLTLPPGQTETPRAFVVLPHGGPVAHDSEEFDWIVQFIASRGYGVLQPQFRGSSGFGAAFQRAGYRQWGGKMQDDVTDATHWLIEQKLADPKRICIVGFSYGGYAALMGAATQPGLYQCAVAIAPVADLAELLAERDRGEFGSVNRDRTVGEEGVQPGQSPIERAGKFPVPVLLIHGRQDFTVPVSQSEAMEAALKRAGRPVSAVYLDQSDHFLSRGPDRLICLRAIDDFLIGQLGDGWPLSPS